MKVTSNYQIFEIVVDIEIQCSHRIGKKVCIGKKNGVVIASSGFGNLIIEYNDGTVGHIFESQWKKEMSRKASDQN